MVRRSRGEPVPHEPRWPSGSKTRQSRLTAEQLKEIRREGEISSDEIAAAFAEFSFTELITQYPGEIE